MSTRCFQAERPVTRGNEVRIFDEASIKRIILEPGEYYVTGEEAVLSTLLGSCVAVCLYDPVQRVAGMNHFLLSNKRYAKELPVCQSEAGKYGIHAMALLIDQMTQLGAERSRLQAKAFGGGSILPKTEEVGNFHCVGDVNCRFVREFLANERIPLVAEELGGYRGRMIYFRLHEYAVYVHPVHTARSLEAAMRDRQWWQDTLKQREGGFLEHELIVSQGNGAGEAFPEGGY
jgi:chemotaxis protein CheD